MVLITLTIKNFMTKSLLEHRLFSLQQGFAEETRRIICIFVKFRRHLLLWATIHHKMQKLVILVAVFATVLSTGNSQEISDKCLGCICQASTGCNKNQGCSQDVCGPFLITWGFWADAGKLVIKGTSPDSPNAYSDCANDLFCASETVRAYSRRYGKDCNKDGVIGCEDFARIHKAGPGGCENQGFLQSDFYKKFQECKAQVNPQ